MNLLSCENCGVVLDKDVLNFAEDFYIKDEWGGWVVDHDLAAWDGNTYVAKVPCPVCSVEILKD